MLEKLTDSFLNVQLKTWKCCSPNIPLSYSVCLSFSIYNCIFGYRVAVFFFFWLLRYKWWGIWLETRLNYIFVKYNGWVERVKVSWLYFQCNWALYKTIIEVYLLRKERHFILNKLYSSFKSIIIHRFILTLDLISVVIVKMFK